MKFVTFDANGQERLGVVDAKRGILDLQKASSNLPGSMIAFIDVSQAQAMDHIFGYTVFNDVTARDKQAAHGQWFKGKSFDTFGPMGPCIVTKDEFGDPSGHRITLRVNGETRQDSNTSDLLFNVP